MNIVKLHTILTNFTHKRTLPFLKIN